MEGLLYDEHVCLCALNRIFGYQPQVGLALYNYAGSAREVFRIPQERLRQLLGRHAGLAAQLGPPALEAAARELEEVQKVGGTFVALPDAAYPALLKECPDPPLGLYIRSRTPEALFGARPAVAVVGTRKVTTYGREWCRRLVRALADAEVRPTIVSGLAYGTDGIAHLAALDYGLPTIGVMATGIDAVYPNAHRGLAAQIADAPGSALLTDYPLRTTPIAANFIRRNRIIAGLSGATLVIESALKGGSLITARYANDYARDVYALPGRIDDPRSAGCNRLLQEHMADIIADPDRLVEALGLGRPGRKVRTDPLEAARKHFGGTLPEETLELLLETLATVRDRRDLTAEDIAALNRRPYRAVADAAGLLQSEGFLEADLLGRCSIPAKYSVPLQAEC